MQLMADDVAQLLERLPYLQVSKQPRAKRYLTSLVSDGVELQGMLAQYPHVCYEPLEPHYALLRGLGALDADLVGDLCRHHTWRGVVAAALLTLLAPDARYRPHLAQAGECASQYRWIVELALAEIDRTPWRADPDMQTLIHRLRDILAPLPRPRACIRRAPSPQQLAQGETERALVRAAYRSGGLDAALQELERAKALPLLRPFRD